MRPLNGRVLFIFGLALAFVTPLGWVALEGTNATTAVASARPRDVTSARAALDRAIEKHGRRAPKQNPELATALRDYESAVASRKAEIYTRLKELDALIAEPRSTTAVDDPAKSPYLHPRPETTTFVAEYDNYRAELSQLGQDLRTLSATVNKSFGVQASGDCPPITPINGTLGSGSPDFAGTSGEQTGRLLNGLGNINCGSSNPCTLNTTTGLRAFDSYTFTNSSSATACVTVGFEMTGCDLGRVMQFSVRLGSFDPANPCTNYVGDGGAGFSGEADGAFSFNVPAGQDFVVVVNENDPGGAVGCAYSITISGVSCQAQCPPQTAINGSVGSGSPDFPALTGQQTGRLLNGLGNISCGSSNPCTLNTTVGQRAFDAYSFINPGASTACVTVSFEMTGCALGQALQFSARLGSFDPSDPCANYVGDGGAGFSGEADGSFSFNVPAGGIFVVVVNENDPGGAVGCDYSLTISGVDCTAAPCTITCPSNITQPNDPGQCGAVVNFPAPTATGECGTITCVPPTGSFFPVGTTTVNCGTTAGPTCSFTVSVNEALPTITCPANVTAVASQTCAVSAGTVVNFPTPAVSAVCPGATVVCSPGSGSAFPIGTTTVTCTATGAGGGTALCSFTVSVFGGCVQDDSNPGNTVLFNSTTGGYIFRCNGLVIATGTGTVVRQGCEIILTHNTSDRRVSIKQSFATGRGSAAIQSPPGIIRCTITDRNIQNNSCQ